MILSLLILSVLRLRLSLEALLALLLVLFLGTGLLLPIHRSRSGVLWYTFSSTVT